MNVITCMLVHCYDWWCEKREVYFCWLLISDDRHLSFRSMWYLDQTGLDWFASHLISREPCLRRSTLQRQDLRTRTTIGRAKFYVEKLLSECNHKKAANRTKCKRKINESKLQKSSLGPLSFLSFICHLFGQLLAKCVWKYKLWLKLGKECAPPLKLWLPLDMLQSCG